MIPYQNWDEVIQQKRKRRQRQWKRVVSIMACVVMFCTTYALILPAITMTDSPTCGMEEHQHGASCYQQSEAVVQAVCMAAPHQHTQGCYDADGIPICGYEDFFLHSHSSDCKQDGKLICTLPEISAHAHSDACYREEAVYGCALQEQSGHSHSEGCYTQEPTLDCALSEGELTAEELAAALICTLTEEAGHTHSEGCFELVRELRCTEEERPGHSHQDDCMSKTLLCALPEIQGHLHEENCFDAAGNLLCQLEEIEGHTHREACYSEPEIVCGQAEDPGHSHTDGCYTWVQKLTCELAEIEGHSHQEGCYGDIQAEPHSHSDSCYVMEERLICELPEGKAHVHTDACITETTKTLICEEPLRSLHTHTQECFDESRVPVCGETELLEHVHDETCMAAITPEPELICEIPPHLHSEACYEAESNEQTLANGERKAVIYTDSTYTHRAEDATVITVSGKLPADGEIRAYPVTVSTDHRVLCAYDIAILRADGSIYEPEEGETLTVSIQAEGLPAESVSQALKTEVFYVPERGEPEPVDALVSEDGVSFVADHFSVYAVMAVDVTAVNNQAALKAAIDAGQSDIRLTGNFGVYIDSDMGAGYGFIDGPLVIPAGARITLDLNGYTIWQNGTDALFEIPAGATLNIIDSQGASETVTALDTAAIGNAATAEVSGNKVKLTYYVTETTLTDPATGATKETAVQHTLTSTGTLNGNDQDMFRVTGGELNLHGGLFYGDDSSGRAVILSSGSVNFQGGYLCGFDVTSGSMTSNEGFGGAVRVSGGEFNLNGGVLAGNSALNGGAIYATGNGVLNILDGVVSGNRSTRAASSWSEHSESGTYRCGGGGIYAEGSAKVYMSGGYLTHNVAEHDGYFDGGGGICLSDNSTMELSGGYVTGNRAQGGSGIRTDFGKAVTFVMTGGYVSGNEATHSEGAGIAIDRGATATVTGGYITNNILVETVHWGGGGLFCADGSSLYMKNVLVTENTAGGFGAGVAGCPTGHLYLYVDQGCAVYNNSDEVDADSPHYVNGGSKNDIDTVRCTGVFLEHGHDDFFCAMQSTVTGAMLGGEPANWEGSADYVPILAEPADTLLASEIMGLTAHPDEGAVAAAQEEAKVFINGNYSYTHGGGIMCNGNLVMGIPSDIHVPARIDLTAQKALYSGSGAALPLEGNSFQFHVTESEPDGTVVATGLCDSEGNITFDHQLLFDGAGTYVYYISEIPDPTKPTITYDSTRYRLTVQVEKDQGVQWLEQTMKYTCSITSLTLEASTDGEAWTTVSGYTEAVNAMSLPLTDGVSFTNYLQESPDITVRKEWSTMVGAPYVTVLLKQDGVEIDRVQLSDNNEWIHTWEDLDSGYIYSVEEIPVPGYRAEYEISTFTDITQTSLGQGSWWVPASELKAGEEYIIVSPDGTKVLYVTSGHENSGFTSADVADITPGTETIGINGQLYSSWYADSGIAARSIFTGTSRTASGNTGVILKNSGTSTTSYLYLASSNSNYLRGGRRTTNSSFIVLEDGYLRGHTSYNWNPNNLRTFVFQDGKFNTVTNQTTDNAARLYQLVSGEATTTVKNEMSMVVITNTRDPNLDYTLPETGGSGTTMYIIGGALPILGVVAFPVYHHRKRRREDLHS